VVKPGQMPTQSSPADLLVGMIDVEGMPSRNQVCLGTLGPLSTSCGPAGPWSSFSMGRDPGPRPQGSKGGARPRRP